MKDRWRAWRDVALENGWQLDLNTADDRAILIADGLTLRTIVPTLSHHDAHNHPKAITELTSEQPMTFAPPDFHPLNTTLQLNDSFWDFLRKDAITNLRHLDKPYLVSETCPGLAATVFPNANLIPPSASRAYFESTQMHQQCRFTFEVARISDSKVTLKKQILAGLALRKHISTFENQAREQASALKATKRQQWYSVQHTSYRFIDTCPIENTPGFFTELRIAGRLTLPSMYLQSSTDPKGNWDPEKPFKEKYKGSATLPPPTLERFAQAGVYRIKNADANTLQLTLLGHVLDPQRLENVIQTGQKAVLGTAEWSPYR